MGLRRLLAAAAALAAGSTRALELAMDRNFADPACFEECEGNWYAFATRDTGNDSFEVQAARADAVTGRWRYLDGVDVLPDTGPFFANGMTWAPAVGRLAGGSYALYYSGRTRQDASKHCVGLAVGESPTGPFRPHAEPFACDLAAGGNIDPGFFRDPDSGRAYVTYKVDGNSIGHGGACGNTVPPLVPTPIMLQEVSPHDGFTKIGDAVPIMDRIDEDGPYVEAPDIYKHSDGTYFLFFNSGCFTDPSYTVKYAWSRDVRGPYTRADEPLLQTAGSLGLVAPGGLTTAKDGSGVVFHADCGEGRCMFTSGFSIEGTKVVLHD